MKSFSLLFVLPIIAAAFLLGCAALQPGADPLVVRTEQVEKVAKANFDLVLNVDNANRPYWETNAPAFHSFCSWLRVKQEAGTNILPRASAMLWSIDRVKLDYKASKADSNTLFTALVSFESVANQAKAYLAVAKATPPTP